MGTSLYMNVYEKVDNGSCIVDTDKSPCNDTTEWRDIDEIGHVNKVVDPFLYSFIRERYPSVNFEEEILLTWKDVSDYIDECHIILMNCDKDKKAWRSISDSQYWNRNEEEYRFEKFMEIYKAFVFYQKIIWPYSNYIENFRLGLEYI